MSWYADGWPQNNLVWHSPDGVNRNQSLVPSDPDNLGEPWPIYFMYNVTYTNGQYFLMDNDDGTYYQGVAGIHSSADGSNFSTDALHNKWLRWEIFGRVSTGSSSGCATIADMNSGYCT
jgi:hypothetical protein